MGRLRDRELVPATNIFKEVFECAGCKETFRYKENYTRHINKCVTSE